MECCKFLLFADDKDIAVGQTRDASDSGKGIDAARFGVKAIDAAGIEVEPAEFRRGDEQVIIAVGVEISGRPGGRVFFTGAFQSDTGRGNLLRLQ